MKLKKVIILYLLLVLCAISTMNAQRRYRSPIPNNQYYDDKLYHFGFLIGINHMNFAIKTYDDYKKQDTVYGIESTGNPGFTVGIVTNLKLHKYWDLRFVPTLSFGERHLLYYINENNVRVSNISKQVESTTVDFPLELKWKSARIQNYRAYVTGGIRYSLDLASNAKKKDVNEDDVIVKLKKNDILFTTGVGFEFYLPYTNKIAIELKMGFGLVDLLSREGNMYTNSIERLTSKNMHISITFE